MCERAVNSTALTGRHTFDANERMCRRQNGGSRRLFC